MSRTTRRPNSHGSVDVQARWRRSTSKATRQYAYGAMDSEHGFDVLPLHGSNLLSSSRASRLDPSVRPKQGITTAGSSSVKRSVSMSHVQKAALSQLGASRQSSEHVSSRPRSQQGGMTRAKHVPKWTLALEAAPEGLFGHPDDPNDRRIFQCVTRRGSLGNTEVVALLAIPLCRVTGLVLTCPGAGGGQGPLDPEGGGGGGTYGGYHVFARLAAELPSRGIAVMLLHYPHGEPDGRPREGGILHTVEHAEKLIEWFLDSYSRSLPVGLVGWSMGGAVAIETAANAIGTCRWDIRCVATIASMRDVSQESPKTIVASGAELLLLHNVNGKCNAANSKAIARMAGGLKPMLHPGEDHGVRSAFDVLVKWLPDYLPRIDTE